jgi:iron complex outermembrane receptor protein
MTHIRLAQLPHVQRRAGWPLSLAAVGFMAATATFAQTSLDSAAEASVLEEIIVTARKVEEHLQDIPMSVQVLSADLLDEIDLTQLIDLQFNIPGLVVNNLGLHGAGFALRGVADQGGSTLAIATHLNGVYLGSANSAITRMFDLERVEVLKGPQGTLYGRNATGGSINLIMRLPEDAFSAEIEAALRSFDTTRLQGHVNIPFENAAFRLAFIGSEGDGFIRNSIDNRTFAENDFRGLRGSLLVQLADKLQLSVMLQHVVDDGEIGELWLPRPDFLVDPSDIRLTTVTLANPYLISEDDNISVAIDYDFGLANLHSITGYARNKVRDLDDCAGLPILRDCVRGTNPTRYDQWSQEFQLVSSGDAVVEWIVGVYFFESDLFRNFYQLTPVIDPNPTIDRDTTSEDSATAAFGQATWHLTERWSMTGGLRLNKEKSRVSTIGTGVNDSPTLATLENSWDNLSWRLDLGYAATDAVLIYAGISTGFKSGGITIVAAGQPGGVLDNFDPEDLTAYEAGVKTHWLNQRLTLNGAAFYYDFRDLQVSTSSISENELIFETDNAAHAEIYGIDTDGVFQITDRLTLTGGVVWLPKREFVEYRNDRTGDLLSGNKLTRAPEWTATAAINYEHALRRHGNLSVRLEYSYRSELFYTIDNDPLFAQDSTGLLNIFLNFASNSEKWKIFASGRNLGNVDYFNQVFLQSSPGYPDTYEMGIGYRF